MSSRIVLSLDIIRPDSLKAQARTSAVIAGVTIDAGHGATSNIAIALARLTAITSAWP